MTHPDDPPPPAPANPLTPTSDDMRRDLAADFVIVRQGVISSAGWSVQAVARAAIRRALYAERALADHVALYTETALRLRGVEDERDALVAHVEALRVVLDAAKRDSDSMTGTVLDALEKLDEAETAKGDGHGERG